MRHYHLSLNLTISEVPEPAFEETPPAVESADPVERDRQETNPRNLFRTMVSELGLTNPGALFAKPPQATAGEAAIYGCYDVSADDLESAVGILKKFQQLAEEIGVPASVGPLNLRHILHGH